MVTDGLQLQDYQVTVICGQCSREEPWGGLKDSWGWLKCSSITIEGA